MKHNPLTPKVNHKQVEFLMLCDTTELLYGGAAGGGKSDALLMGALQFVEVPGYAAVLFRRTYMDLSLPGALMDRAHSLLGGTGARWDGTQKTWSFPSGATLSFGYLDSENDRFRYQSCFHPDTEILTADGWKKVEDVKVGDMAATLEQSTRTMEYRPVSNVWEYDHDGELITLKKGKDLSFAVTPIHKIWASNFLRTRRTGDVALRSCEAQDLPYTAAIPQWANWNGDKPQEQFVFQSPGHNGRKVSFTSMQWAEFLGWYIAEGCANTSRWAINISQKNPIGRSLISGLLTRCHVNYHETPKLYTFNNRALVEHLREHTGTLAGNKRIPNYVKMWDREHLLALLDSLVEGDGTWRDVAHNSGHFVTSSDQLKDDVCDISIKAGYRPTVSLRQGNSDDSPFGTKPRWHVFLLRLTHDTMVSGHVQHVPYSGKVYCVTVPPYHMVMTRHNNRVSWSGQSEFQYIAFDELTQFKERDYRYLFSRLRRTVDSQVPLRMRAGSNPGGTGHMWVKKRFDPEGRRPATPGRVFIGARLEDNPYLNTEEYDRLSLSQLDAHTRRQYRSGDWTDFGGNHYFPDSWPHYIDTGDAYRISDGAGRWRHIRKAECVRLLALDWAMGKPKKDKSGAIVKGLDGNPELEGDCTAFIVADMTDDEDGLLFLLGCTCERIPLGSNAPRLAEQCQRWSPVIVASDDDNMTETMMLECRRFRAIPTIKTLGIRSRNKVTRSQAAIVRSERGKVYLPEHTSPWVEMVCDHLAAFTGIDGEPDDIADTVAILGRLADEFRPGEDREQEDPVVGAPGYECAW